eukprot:831309-Pleurochrysis_carterae.AAC.1
MASNSQAMANGSAKRAMAPTPTRRLERGAAQPEPDVEPTQVVSKRDMGQHTEAPLPCAERRVVLRASAPHRRECTRTLPASLKSAHEKDWRALMSVFMSMVSSSARSGPCSNTASSSISVLSTTRGRCGTPRVEA